MKHTVALFSGERAEVYYDSMGIKHFRSKATLITFKYVKFNRQNGIHTFKIGSQTRLFIKLRIQLIGLCGTQNAQRNMNKEAKKKK